MRQAVVHAGRVLYPMNKSSYSNPCTRCGSERIVAKTWEEKLGNSVIVSTQRICPNPECQKKVDSENKKQKDKHEAMRQKSEQRALERKASKDAERAERLHTQ